MVKARLEGHALIKLPGLKVLRLSLYIPDKANIDQIIIIHNKTNQ